MIDLVSGQTRGLTRMDWLDSRHTFSFSDYYEPSRMGFGVLRVLNDDRVQPGAGFGSHPHADMEILTYILEGALAHRDSTGTSYVMGPGDVQRMSAGTGVVHSELNPSKTEPVRLLQIWILPEWRGLAPSYEQKTFPEALRRERLALVASKGGKDGSVSIHQDVNVYAGILEPEQERVVNLGPGRRAWLQVAKGEVYVNGVAAREGDGLAITDETRLRILGGTASSEILLFEMA